MEVQMKSVIKILLQFNIVSLFTLVIVLSSASLRFSEMYAQEKAVCEDSLNKADVNYQSGNWEESIRLINECLAEPNISETEKGVAYRLLGLVYIATELEKQANDAVKNLLIMVPNYKIDPDRDPPQLKILIDTVSQQLVPIISSITPNSVDAESEELILIVKGSDFVYGSTVQFDKMEKVTTYVNQNQLSAELSAIDLMKEGEYEVTVFSPIHGGKISNAVKFTVTATSSFPWTWIAVGGGAVAAAVVAVIVWGGDGNGDGDEGTLPGPPTRP
jgi:hypothetical protein